MTEILSGYMDQPHGLYKESKELDIPLVWGVPLTTQVLDAADAWTENIKIEKLDKRLIKEQISIRTAGHWIK